MSERKRPYGKRKRPYQEFECLDCGINTLLIGEYYMLTNEAWESMFPGGDNGAMLCICCVERRLGRVLTRKDFSKAPINDIEAFRKSPLLTQRISGNYTAYRRLMNAM